MKKNIWLTGFVFIVVFVAVVGLLGFLYINSGNYNIAATEPHMDITLDVIDMMMTASVRNHAEGIDVPDLTDSLAGFAAYDDMCVDCHGAPGIGRSEFGQGLYPMGPSMTEADTIWTDAELFWIVKHGIKMTGMPAFGPTHSDDEIWPIVAFIRKLPDMGYYDYVDMQDSLSQSGGGHEGHEH